MDGGEAVPLITDPGFSPPVVREVMSEEEQEQLEYVGMYMLSIHIRANGACLYVCPLMQCPFPAPRHQACPQAHQSGSTASVTGCTFR